MKTLPHHLQYLLPYFKGCFTACYYFLFVRKSVIVVQDFSLVIIPFLVKIFKYFLYILVHIRVSFWQFFKFQIWNWYKEIRNFCLNHYFTKKDFKVWHLLDMLFVKIFKISLCNFLGCKQVVCIFKNVDIDKWASFTLTSVV